jgi:CheY-like chemotaxis protein
VLIALKVLLVHADPWVRAELGDLLRLAGCSVVERSNGAGCLRHLTKGRPDLIIVGPSLPEISCDELMQLLRADPDTRPIPIMSVGSSLEEFEWSEHVSVLRGRGEHAL